MPAKGSLQSAGAMHDGSKRRLVADAADGDAPSGWEQVDAGDQPTYGGRIRTDDTVLEEALIAALDASPVIGAAASQLEADNDAAVEFFGCGHPISVGEDPCVLWPVQRKVLLL